MRKLIFLFLVLASGLGAQEEDFLYENRVYADNIKSVKFHIEGLFLSRPVVDLNSQTPLRLSFDDLDGNVKTYTYSIIHCDSDWQPSQLTQMEYLEGFSEMPIRDYRFASQTVTHYTHYSLELPNQDMRWTKSGNYLLVVYEDEGEKFPVITRRFMVVDPKVAVQPELVRTAQVSKSRTHQEIDFIVSYEKFDIRTPLTEISAVVMQNGRWDNAITGLRPAFTRPRQLVFDYQDKIVFAAGKEFRFFDLRSLRSRSEGVALIERFKDRTEATLYKDEKRMSQSYNFIQDVNGQFVIESYDYNNADWTGDYASVLFMLYSPEPYYDHEVYIVGEMTDWQPKDEFRMVYNESVNGYVAKPLLKQGFYNYAYAVVPRKGKNPSIDLSEIEGDWYQTENEYTLLIYYRPFGSRYDQLIGVRSFNFNPR